MRLLRFRRGTESVTANAAPHLQCWPVALSKHGLIARPNLRRYTVAGRLSVFNCFFAVHSTLDYCTVPGWCLLVFSSRFILRSFLPSWLPEERSPVPRCLPSSASVARVSQVFHALSLAFFFGSRTLPEERSLTETNGSRRTNAWF